VGAGALVAAAVATALVSGCASQKLGAQTETVSTASASAAASAAESSTCPATAPQTLASNVSGLSTQLVPFSATKVLLCVYPSRLNLGSSSGASDTSSGSASPGAPTAVTLTNAGVISSLENGLNALAAPPTTPVNCPNDNGSEVLGIFTNGSQESEVLMKTSGCPEATNGHKTGWVGASDFGSILSAVLKGV
jgi:hypothetical protein